MLPHVLLGDLVRFLIDRVSDAGAGDPAVGSALAPLEQAARSDDERLRNLTVVSFLENLDPDDEAARELLRSLGPTLRSHLPKP